MARKRRRTPATKQDGLGGLFRRRSRHQKGHVLETWWLRYSVNGRQVRESSGTTVRTDALDMLRVKLGKVAKHEIQDLDRERLTVKHLMETLLARYEQKGRASLKSGARATAKVWTDALGDVRAVHLTNKTVERTIAEWKVSGATVNRRLALLRHAYRLSKIMMDPARLDVRDLWRRESDPRQAYMAPATFRGIAANLPPYLADFFTFAYYTGIRRGQLAATRWADVDCGEWVITWESQQTKAKKPQTLALAGEPLEIVRRRWRDRPLGCEYVFHRDGLPVGNFRKSWDKALKAAGVAGVYRFHDTRRAAITHAVDTGTAAHTAMSISGHRTRAMLDRYSIPLLAEQRAALSRSTEHVEHRLSERKVVPITG